MTGTRLKQYLLINKDIDMSMGKLAVQTAHASARFERAVATGQELPLFQKELYEKWLQDIETKIAVRAKPSLLEKLEAEGWIGVRDAGLSELTPGTLTVIISPPLERELAPNWLRRLQQYDR